MARFDVYQNPIAEQRRTVPYWLDIQSDFVESLQHGVVLPLRLRTEVKRSANDTLRRR